eukprot:Gb_35267 [translate_table: standard]
MKRTLEKRYSGGNEECVPRSMLTPYPFERRILSHQFLFLNESGDMIQPLFAPVHREGPVQTGQWYASTHAEPRDKVYYHSCSLSKDFSTASDTEEGGGTILLTILIPLSTPIIVRISGSFKA